MCGIAGIARFAPLAPLEHETQRMLDALVHRGPDDAGTLTFGPIAGLASLAIGARRLAIIDLSPAGHQPMESADGRYAIVLNGEIYNYLELRRELESLGHAFRSRSDTEVLLAAFAAWGTSCWRRLVGMFACAILDRTARRLVLARDPFGMKPLYYVTRAGALTFASEIPPLLPLLGGRPRAHAQRVYEYLDSGITDHARETMFAGVHSLPAAHYAAIDLARPDVVAPVRFWELDPEQTEAISFEAAVQRLRERFLENITLHLRSDVEVGALLSGGIDSSAIVMAMRFVAGPKLDLHTFSYVGGQGALTEEPWIDLVNRAAGAIPHKLHMSPDEWSADAVRLVKTQNEPFGSIAIYAQHRVFRMAAEAGIKVVLDGQGADELLAGYRSHWAVRLASLLEQQHWVAAYQFIRRLAVGRQPFDPPTWRTALRASWQALPAGARSAIRRVIGSRRPWIDDAWSARSGIHASENHQSHVRPQRRLQGELWRSVQEQSLPALLRYEDRNAMAHSIESRLPYLTPTLAEAVLPLPDEYVLSSEGTGKRVFRAAMRGIVPDQILDRRDKIGFAVPVRTWLPAIPGVVELLELAAQLPPVNAAWVEPYLAQLRLGRTLLDRTSFLLWRLIGIAAWVRDFDVVLD